MSLNGFNDPIHAFVQADCVEWLKDDRETEKFDLIYLDPPSFSNSKRMKQVFDIQKDHRWMIERTMRRLKKGGLLIFSNNLRNFKLDESLTQNFTVTDKTQASIPKDFERNKKVHRCWFIQDNK